LTGLFHAALVALVLTGTGACGGGALSASPSGTSPPAPPTAAISCSATRGLPLPAGWPAAVPLPPRLVVTRIERRSGDRLIAYFAGKTTRGRWSVGLSPECEGQAGLTMLVLPTPS